MKNNSEKLNILIILPPSIAGTLIMRGFKTGFEQLGNKVLAKDYRELDKKIITDFSPDIVLGYDYSYLIDKSLIEIINQLSAKKLFYFADEPKSNYAMFSDEIFEKFEKTENKTVFIWDKKIAKTFNNALYLPLAVDITSYDGEDFKKDYDITFVGRPLGEKRQKILSAVVKNFGEKLKIFSFEKHFERSISEIKEQKLLSENELDIYKQSLCGFLATEKELANVYRKSKINLNITLQGESSLNYRVFEVLASGGFLLTDKIDDNTLFEEKQHFDTWEDEKDLIEKIKYYLEYDARACRFGQTAKRFVAEHHTFKIRAQEMLKAL